MKKIKTSDKLEESTKKKADKAKKEPKPHAIKKVESIETLTNSELISFKKEVKTEMDMLQPMCMPGRPPIPEFVRFLNIYKKLTDEFNKRLDKLIIN